MSYRTVHGVVSWRPGDSDYTKLDSAAIATATGLSVFLPANAGNFAKIVIQYTSIEKPDGVTWRPFFVISTNGATFEVGNAYNYQNLYYTATTALAASGAIGASQLGFGGLAVANGLATATSGRSGEMTFTIYNPGATTSPHLSFEGFYMSSASSPVSVYAHGFYASAPILGVQLMSGANNFSGIAHIWGVGRLP